MRKLPARSVAMKLFKQKHPGKFNNLMDFNAAFRESWVRDRMNEASDRYDERYKLSMVDKYGWTEAKQKRKRAGADEGSLKKKRAPTAYNLFVKEFMAKNKHRYTDHREMMRAAGAAWRHKQG